MSYFFISRCAVFAALIWACPISTYAKSSGGLSRSLMGLLGFAEPEIAAPAPDVEAPKKGAIDTTSPYGHSFVTGLSPKVDFLSFQTMHHAFDGGGAEFSLAGLDFHQWIYWGKWVSLDANVAYACSIGGTAPLQVDPLAAKAYTLDAGALLYGRIPLDKTLFLEPMVGFSVIRAVMHRKEDNSDFFDWQRLLYHGPSCGLYVKMHPTKVFSMRVGGAYMMTSLKDREVQEPGYNVTLYRGRTRRHGLSAALSFNYIVSKWWRVHMGMNYQSWSTGIGKAAPTYRNGALAPMLRRTQFSWGSQLTY